MEQNAVAGVGRVSFWPFLSWSRWQFYTKAITKILHKYSKSFQLQGSESELTN